MKRHLHPLTLLLVLTSAQAAADTGVPEVLASYRDAVIVTTADFSAAIHGLPENAREAARTNPKAATAMLETVLLNRVLAKQAREQGLADSAEVKAELEQVADRALSVRRIEALEAALSIPDYAQAAKEQYDLNKAKYMEQEQLRAAHVLIATQGKDAEAARKLATEIHAKAVAGADFAKLVDEFSDDRGSKARGGDLGFFVRGRMVKEFEQAAFALQNPGDLSPVIQSPFGFHVIKLIERKSARQKEFDEVKAQIIAPMRAKFVNAEKARLTSAIRNDSGIKLDTAAIDRLIGARADAKAAAPTPAPPAAK
jgi:peptidyl-prolyl cis-trans isomerase C